MPHIACHMQKNNNNNNKKDNFGQIFKFLLNFGK